ncbi:hypothetical protein HDIA_3448 [Hartmannibacter diazotrophicus]|uniref:Glycosyltransferase n=1 Tax=Hartmannibacter diazotrophicus TaxID=1482074 RepID=A0A2C9D9X7_9HYPH|nr:hypothetical protein [Hartmannibacter diazotrophicus]SON56989.1 hypothetical protein HDIA_3448 [Hartmannibacter diazotrophicus]
MQTVVCMKWGTRYPADYVNRLWSMIRRNTRRPTRLVCFTENTDGIDPEVMTHPLPAINLPERFLWYPWRKISLWQAPLADLEGEVLYVDLDVVITGNIDDFFDFSPGSFCVAENWTQPGQKIGNTSIYKWTIGQYHQIFDDLNADPEKIVTAFRIEQQYISAVVDKMVFWPSDWCYSFKHSLIPRWPLNFILTPRLPENARIIAFTGKPDPDEAEIGRWPVNSPWKKLYKHVRPTPWITENWR